MAITPIELREIMSRFATGVTVVTFCVQQENHGLTVNAFTSVSLDPPLILVCIQKEGTSHDLISKADSFAVNILSEDQMHLASRFADPALDSAARFKNLKYKFSPNAHPVFENILGFIDCQTVNTFEGGDHTIFLARVEHAEIGDTDKPLLFFNGQYYRF